MDENGLTIDLLLMWSYGFVLMMLARRIVQWLPFETLKNDINNVTVGYSLILFVKSGSTKSLH